MSPLWPGDFCQRISICQATYFRKYTTQFVMAAAMRIISARTRMITCLEGEWPTMRKHAASSKIAAVVVPMAGSMDRGLLGGVIAWRLFFQGVDTFPSRDASN